MITGNPGHRPLPTNEPMPVGNLEATPDFLTASQQEGWRYVLEKAPYGLLKDIDRSILMVWVVADDMYKQALDKVAKHGLLWKSPSGGVPGTSPFVHIMNRQADVMMRAVNELGFSPASRTRIKMPEQVSTNEFARLRG